MYIAKIFGKLKTNYKNKVNTPQEVMFKEETRKNRLEKNATYCSKL